MEINPLSNQLQDLTKRQNMITAMQGKLLNPQQNANVASPFVNAIMAFALARKEKSLAEERKNVFKDHEQKSKDATQNLLFALGLGDPPKQKEPLQGPQQLQQTQPQINTSTIPLNPSAHNQQFGDFGGTVQPLTQKQALVEALGNKNLDPTTKALFIKQLLNKQSQQQASGLQQQKMKHDFSLLDAKQRNALELQNIKNKGDIPKIVQLQNLRDSFPEGSQKRNEIDMLIKKQITPKKGMSFSTNPDGSISLSMGGTDDIKLRPGEVIKTDSLGNKRVENIPGSDIQTREQAATGQSIKQGVKFANEFITGAEISNPKTGEIVKVHGFINKDGSVNRQLVFMASNNVPWSDGRTHRRRLLEMIQGKLRAETGAAAPIHEVSNLMERFMPNITDSDATIFDKINSLKNFSSEFIARIDPSLYRRLREKALKNQGIKNQKAIDSIISKEISLRGGGDLTLKENSKDETINTKARKTAVELRKKFPDKSKQEIIDMTRKQLGL